jgi:hypothetical protein
MPTSDLSSKPPAAAPSPHSKPSASPSPESLSPPRRSRRVSNYRVCALEYNVDKLIVNNAFLLQYNIAPRAILNRLSLVSWLLELCDQRKIQRDGHPPKPRTCYFITDQLLLLWPPFHQFSPPPPGGERWNWRQFAHPSRKISACRAAGCARRNLSTCLRRRMPFALNARSTTKISLPVRSGHRL